MPSLPKILVAMSGGVDSSVAAALLVRSGKYQVVGAYMKQWSDDGEIRGVCPWKEDRREALRVAAALGIPLLTLDFEKEYREWVMKYLFDEYERGRTPNPDVMCNRWIKFGFWLTKARELGFQFLATGHYAQIQGVQSGSETVYQLCEAKDQDKDQTYFLHQLNQDQLSAAMFPIGEYTKSEVRQLATEFRLPTANRAESMGICFVGEVPMKEFLAQRIAPTPGNIVTSTGEVVGRHDGLAFYTIGQRNVRVSVQTASLLENGENRPWYVVQKRFKENELVVGHEDDPLLFRSQIEVEEVHWIDGQPPIFPLKCLVRLRHRQEKQQVVVQASKSGSAIIIFSRPERAPTPGQFAVFYHQGVCLGGGVII